MGITRETTASKNTAVPAKLMALCKEHGEKALAWECLARAGRHGYKHCGLRISVTRDSQDYTTAEIARTLMGMMEEHQAGKGDEAPEGYRVDALGDGDDRLNGDGDFIRFLDGEAEDEEIRDKGSWALKALGDTHKRYLAILDRIEATSQVATDALDAMTRVVGDSLQVQREDAEQRRESEEEGHRHERQMKLLEFLMSQAGGGAGTGTTPLLDLLNGLDAKTAEQLENILGSDNYAAFKSTAANPDRGARGEALMALMQRLQGDEAIIKGMNTLPPELNKKFRATIMAEIRAGATA